MSCATSPDTKLDLFPSPLAKAQIGAALSMMGDKERAEKTFATALDSLEDKKKSVTLAAPTSAPTCATQQPS